ncbi:MAG: hypothetical protein U0936_01885 [Planctomycetaceae bacterium]
MSVNPWAKSSVKAVSDVYAPGVSGEILEVNEKLPDNLGC